MPPTTTSSASSASPTTSSPTSTALSSTAKHLTAGLFSGISSAVILQPADLLKTRIQQAPPKTSLYKLTLSIPFFELWRGTLPSALRTGIGSALYFTTLNHLRSAVAGFEGRRRETGQHSSSLVRLGAWGNLITGGVARAGIGFVMMPVTVIKVRMECDLFKVGGMTAVTKEIWRTSGVRGFFAGYGVTAIRDAPYAGLYVLFYETAKGRLSSLFPSTSSEHVGGTGEKMSATRAWTINSLAAMVSGAAATAVTNPFDTIKTRIQIFPGRYRNMWVAGWKIVNEEGVRRLFDGLGLRMARKAVSSGVVWGAYEWAVSKSWRKPER